MDRAERTVGILSYNIYNGLQSGAVASFVQQVESLDVTTLLLNEHRINDDGERLLATLGDAGFAHTAVGRSASRAGNNANCNAVVSREPFEVVANREDFRFMAVRQGELTLCAYHASPRGVAAVLPEVEQVVTFLAGHDATLLAGDMNSLAADDGAVLGYDADRGGLERYMHNGSLSFEAIDRLKRCGLRDLNIDPERYTVPTAVGRKAEAGHPLRLDYAFAKGRLANELEARILRGEPFDTLSDHYPLLIRRRSAAVNASA